MTVSVSDRVWERWRELSSLYQESSIALLFTSALAQQDALVAVRSAADDAIAERVTRSELEEFSPGASLVAPAPAGTVLVIDEDPDDLEGLVSEIASALDRRGVEGAFDLYEPSEVVPLPAAVPLVECRLRVKGKRPPAAGLTWRWLAEPDSMDAGVEAGVAWCLERPDDRPLQLVASTMPPVMLGEDDDVDAYVRQAIDLTPDGGVVRLTSWGA